LSKIYLLQTVSIWPVTVDPHPGKTADEAAAAFDDLGGPVAVVKSQIHAGGRGKGTFKEQPSQHGVQLVKSAEEAKQAAANMLGNTLVTIQTGEAGKVVNQIIVEAGKTGFDVQPRRRRRDRKGRP